MALNVEIKAVCKTPQSAIDKLHALGADYKGCDHQIDTYFKVNNGRLKLREGNIERNLIQYHRVNQAGPKSSFFKLFPVPEDADLKIMLENSLGILTVVDKKRHIFYIENVKFHVDEVKDLGHFVEIEAGDLLAPKTSDELNAQCNHYMKELNIDDSDLIEISYSDLILNSEVHE